MIVASATFAAPAAFATASGSTVNGCRAQYFSTAFSTKCGYVTRSASFRTTGWCSAQPTVSGPWVWLGKGSSANGVSAGQCTFGVNSAQTYAK